MTDKMTDLEGLVLWVGCDQSSAMTQTTNYYSLLRFSLHLFKNA